MINIRRQWLIKFEGGCKVNPLWVVAKAASYPRGRWGQTGSFRALFYFARIYQKNDTTYGPIFFFRLTLHIFGVYFEKIESQHFVATRYPDAQKREFFQKIWRPRWGQMGNVFFGSLFLFFGVLNIILLLKH